MGFHGFGMDFLQIKMLFLKNQLFDMKLEKLKRYRKVIQVH